MDVNGSRFQLILGYDNWAACSDEQGRLGDAWTPALESDRDPVKLNYDLASQELTLQKRLFRFLAAPRDVAPRLENRRGAGKDRYGNWYWIGENRREIMVNSSGSGQTSHFWAQGDDSDCGEELEFGEFGPKQTAIPPVPTLLSGLAVTQDHYLVVGTLEPPGLLAFDLHAGGPPYQVRWPEGVNFGLLDMAVRPGGGVFILDHQNARFWELDRKFNIVEYSPDPTNLTPDEFQPEDGTFLRQSSHRLLGGVSLTEIDPELKHDWIAIEAMPDGTVLLLDNGPDPNFSSIYRYRNGQRLGERLSTAALREKVEAEKRENFRLVGYDLAFLPANPASHTEPGQIYIVSADGNQTFAFRLSLPEGQPAALEPIEEFYPMRLFGGKALVAVGNQLFYDFQSGWIPLVAQRRPRYEAEATLFSPVLDGHDPDCVWHRLMLDGCLPPGTAVEIWSCAANEQADLNDLNLIEWKPETKPYLRGDGSELPFLNRPALSGDGNGTWEVLFQQAKGRYLRLKLRLSGDERNSPRLRALRAYYPRFSYLERYLPAVYRQDKSSASFLDRFLANVEGLYTSLEDKIAAVQILFDLRSAPPETLDWLASWFGVALDPAWNEAQQRLFIRHIMDFFQYRGTIAGLMMALRLALETCADESIFNAEVNSRSRFSTIRIVEKYRTRRTPGVIFGDTTDFGGPQVLDETKLAGRWQPGDGGAALHQRYRAFVNPQLPQNLRFDYWLFGLKYIRPRLKMFPLVEPQGAEGPLWREFCQAVLGFIPASSADDQSRWQNFMLRRYQTVAAYNTVYQSAGLGAADFSSISLPGSLPPDGAPLVDWYQFQAVALAMQRTAHRFTVLVAMPRSGKFNSADFQTRIELAKRIVELEKPSHTVFEVKYFWAMFRVGEARLGEDTLLDLGSRAPQLLPPLVLGQNYLAESYLGAGHPQNVPDRQLLGRDRLGG